ncbi:MAG: hypothetical protein KAT68_03290 [Bacteroidales bacterium]|nr:hypothetical protein [Bacteroidales bacterium]
MKKLESLNSDTFKKFEKLSFSDLKSIKGGACIFTGTGGYCTGGKCYTVDEWLCDDAIVYTNWRLRH